MYPWESQQNETSRTVSQSSAQSSPQLSKQPKASEKVGNRLFRLFPANENAPWPNQTEHRAELWGQGFRNAYPAMLSPNFSPSPKASSDTSL